jgi:8-oxo-dGTP pyrophosphatase MutT (NUDIX family)
MTDEVAGKTMVAGFMFHGPRVLLVQKLRPTWQAGLYNGVGGAVERDETLVRAMTREFYEETGQLTLPGDWEHFCTEHEPFGATVHFFKCAVRLPETHVVETPSQNDAGELLSWHHCEDVQRMPVLGNLRWLVPLARDWRGVASPVVVRAVGDIRERASW